MNRRASASQRRVPAVLALALMLALLACGTAAAAPAPNVLFIVTDDQALETMQVSNPVLDPMWKTKRWFHTGGENALGSFEGGTFFRRAVATTPLCCPARASILTGRYAHNHGVKDTLNSPGPPTTNLPTGASALDKRTTLARYLRDAGYYTGIFGKYLNGWNLSQRPDHPYANWDEWAVFDNLGTPSGFEVGEQGVRKYVFQHETDYVADKALDFVRRAKTQRDNVPWFMYLAPTAPHSPFNPPPRHADAPVPALDEGDPAYFEQDRRDKPPWTQTSLLDGGAPPRGWDSHMRMLRAVDDMVDAVMTDLQSQGEDRDTIAFFVSDNGFQWGEHGLYQKNLPYEESIRIPFLLRWPSGPVARNHTSDRLVANVDMATTVVDAVNDAFGGPVVVPDPVSPMDGMSLIDPAQGDRDAVLTEGWGRGSPEGTRGYCVGIAPSWAALTTPSFHYVEHYETRPLPSPGQTTPPVGCSAREYVTRYENEVFKEYYDTRAGRDPGELTNLLADDNVSPIGTLAQFDRLMDDGAPENNPPTATLESRLAQLRTCSGATCIPQAGGPATPPVDVAITAAPGNPSGFDDASFSFTATEPGATFRCSLGGGSSTPCTSPVRYTGLGNGRHRFRVVASAGGDSDVATHTWTIDDDLPDARITSKPTKSSTSSEAGFEWEGSAAAASFFCTLDGGFESSCESPHTSSALADGEHTFSVSARRPGSQDPTPPTFTWQVDTRAPDTQLTRSDTFSSFSSGATFNIVSTFASGDPGFVGRFDCQLDGGQWEPCDTPKTLLQQPGGHRTLMVKATDLAGNEDISPANDAWDIGPIQVFGSVPDSRWPEISEGTEVRDIVPDGSGGWFVGGDFTKVRDALGEHSHTDLVHIRSTMTVDNSWNPSTNGTVRTMALSPTGTTLYIGGTFTTVSGTSASTANTPRGRLAALAVSTGNPTVWNPDASNDVNAIAIPPAMVTGGTISSLYAAGAFQMLKNSNPFQRVTRRKVAEISLTGDGAATSWNPNADSSATLSALAVTERHVYVGGYLSTLGGPPTSNPLTSRANLAAIDRFDGKAASWSPDANAQVVSLELRNRAAGLRTLYAGGSFTSIGAPAGARSGAAELNLSDNGSVTAWEPAPTATGAPGSVHAFLSFACPVFGANDPACATIVGGAFDSVQADGASRVTRAGLAQVDMTTGFAHGWDPDLNQPALALACWPSPDFLTSAPRCDNSQSRVLAVGGAFTQANGAPRARLAFFARP